MAGTKSDVRDYWEARPCGEGLSHAERGSEAYFAEIEAEKDRIEPYVKDFADFPRWCDREVLEIGCGLGTDTVRFARERARVTAVDLTETAVLLTRERLAGQGLTGTVVQADAESLPFRDASFDLVYSWGVLHHTPDTARAIRELARVVRPSGEVRVMLYNRHSFFAAAVWLRRGLLAGRVMSLRAALATGLESPGTKGYTREEVETLFEPFGRVEVRTIATAYDRRIAGPAARAVPRLGWNHLVRASLFT